MGRAKLAEFISANYDSLLNFARSRLSDTAQRDSEDIVQDVMLSLIDGRTITDPIVNLSAYVFRALRNRIIDEYRKPRNAVQSLDSQLDSELTLYDILPDLKYEPEGSYARGKLREEIEHAIESLPESQQAVIVETEFNGTAIRELARRTGTPPGTLLARKHRGLKTVKEKLAHIKEEHYGNS